MTGGELLAVVSV